jgi:hypothetical protein
MRKLVIATFGGLSLLVMTTGSSSAGILWDDSYPADWYRPYRGPWATGYGVRWYGPYRRARWVRHRRHLHRH